MFLKLRLVILEHIHVFLSLIHFVPGHVFVGHIHVFFRDMRAFLGHMHDFPGYRHVLHTPDAQTHAHKYVLRSTHIFKHDEILERQHTKQLNIRTLVHKST